MKQQNHYQISQFYPLMIAIKLLLLFSAFSFIFSQSSFLPLLLRIFSFASPFSMKFLDYTTDKNYMFLLCNGIIVFVIKNSGLIRNYQPKSGFGDNHNHVRRDDDSLKLVVVDEQRKKRTEVPAVMEVQEQEDEPIDEFQSIQEEEEEEKEEEIIGLLSAEELQKKCDEFIKKMKEEIKIGAREVVVY